MKDGMIRAGLILAVYTSGIAHAAVPGWRGDGTGKFAATSAPLQWSQTEGIAWKTPLPEWANACPILVDGRLFITAEPNKLICLSTADGTIAWERTNPKSDTIPAAERAEFAAKAAQYEQLSSKSGELNGKIRGIGKQLRAKPENADELKAEQEKLKAQKAAIDSDMSPLSAYGRPKTHGHTGYATPTPVSDGVHVYVEFGDGIVACYALDGTRKWIRFVASSKHGWGHSASPILVDNKLIVHIAGTVYALNPADGSSVWTVESSSKWGTPTPFQVGNAWAIITTGGDVLRVSDGHMVAKGIAKLPWSSPLVEGDTLYVVDEGGALALRIPDAMADELAFEAIWNVKPEKGRYYATPLYVDGLLYAVHSGGMLSVFDAASGAVVYSRKLALGGTVYPSPFLAGGSIYVSSDAGKTVVLEPGREYVERASNSLEGFRSTPIADSGRIYVRGLKNLYCIAGTQK